MNKLDVSNLITQEINGLLCTKTERLYIGASLSEERIKKAIKAFSVSVIPEDVVCIIDESIFQNASLGFLFTPDKLYYRPSLSKSKKSGLMKLIVSISLQTMVKHQKVSVLKS